MKPAIKILLIGAVVLFAGVEAQAQNKKKKPQDSEYVLQKERMDAERKREKEERMRNDSIRRNRYRDSMAESHRNDSIRYSKMGAPDTINPANMNQRDTLNNGMPPQMEGDKTAPPKMEGEQTSPPKMEGGGQPKGTDASGIRRIDFSALPTPAIEIQG